MRDPASKEVDTMLVSFLSTWPKLLSFGKRNGGIFSIELLSTQMTVAHGKSTKRRSIIVFKFYIHVPFRITTKIRELMKNLARASDLPNKGK